MDSTNTLLGILSDAANTLSEESDISHMSNSQITPITPEGEKPVLSARLLLLSFQFRELKKQHQERYRRYITPFLRSAITSITASYPLPTFRRGRSASITASSVSSNSLLADQAGSEISFPLPWTKGETGRSSLPQAVVEYRREAGDYLTSSFFVHWLELNETKVSPPVTPNSSLNESLYSGDLSLTQQSNPT